MAKMIVSLRVGIIFCAIVLLSAGVLQPIDCLEDKALFDLLNDETLGYEDVDQSLEAVDNRDEVELGGISVSELSSSKVNSGSVCQLEELQDIYSNIVASYKDTNAGLYKFCRHNFIERVTWCAKSMAEAIERLVKDNLDAEQMNVVIGFDSYLSELGKDGEELTRESVSAAVEQWRSSRKADVESSCEELDQIVTYVDPEQSWHELEGWLEKKISCPWRDRARTCSMLIDLRDGDQFDPLESENWEDVISFDSAQ